MMHEEWARDLVGEVLAELYDVTATTIDPVHQGTETINWRAQTENGPSLHIKQYRRPTTDDEQHARAAWDMSEYCRAADLPVPRVWPDRDGHLLTTTGGMSYAVLDEVSGRVATGPMTVEHAEHLGLVLGRMHRVLAAYPLLPWHRPPRWRTLGVDEGIARCTYTLNTARKRHEPHLSQVREDLEQRRDDLQRHTSRLRAGLPDELVEQSLHADVARPNILTLTDVVTAIVDFRAETATVAWELGRAVFDPHTVAHGTQWVQCAVRMLEAYRSQNPTLPRTDIRSCPRIALLYMLHSFYGSTTAEYPLTDEARADLRQHWADRQLAIRHLLANLDDLETALATIKPGR